MTICDEKDKVTFLLPSRYYYLHGSSQSSGGMRREDAYEVLWRAFGLPKNECKHLMRDKPHHISFTCRLDQFAKFIIYRNEFGNCINGVKDLQPKLAKLPDRYGRIEQMTGVPRRDVKLVMNALEFSRQQDAAYKYLDTHIDVSDRDLPQEKE